MVNVSMAEDDEDVYVTQLREVYESCDLTGKGFLDRDELVDLCQKLQLEDQIPALIRECLGDGAKNGEVTFDTFKDAFVMVLSQAIDSMAETTEEDHSEVSELEHVEPPKAIVNEKRYGRRSRPGVGNISGDSIFQDDNDEEEQFNKRNSNQNSPILDSNGNGRPRVKRHSSSNLPMALRKKISSDSKSLFREEVLGGTGAISNSSGRKSSQGSDFISKPDEEHLRSIWEAVSVGANGFLEMEELSVVCEHIGMESIDEQELQLLFHELDADGDGHVSFDEFLHGLFLASRTDTPDNDDSSSIASSGIKRGIDMISTPVIGGANSPRTKAAKIIEETPMKSVKENVDILSFLDGDNSGLAKIDLVEEYFKTNEMYELLEVMSELEPDAEGKVSLQDVNMLMESVVHERGDDISQAVFQTYKNEISHLRGQLDVIADERDKLKQNVSRIGEDSTILIQEGEEQTRQVEQHYERKLQMQEKLHNDRLQQRDHEWALERQHLTQALNDEKTQMEDDLTQARIEEAKLKAKLADAEGEIIRLQRNLAETSNELTEEQKKMIRLEKELGSTVELHEKLTEIESDREFLREQYENAANTIRELQEMNKELRDVNDELQVQIENLKAQLTSMGKRKHRRRHVHAKESKEMDRLKAAKASKVDRNGSYLSEYTKPTIIKRNDDGETESEFDDEDSFDDLSFDDSTLETAELPTKVKEQERVIEQLQSSLERAHALMDSDTAQVVKRYEAELGDLTEKFTSEIEQLHNTYNFQKEGLERRSDGKSNVMNGLGRERDEGGKDTDSERSEAFELFKKEKKKLETWLREEKEEIEMNYRGQLTKLEEQVVILETEKAELELKFVNEKAEMEQQFRIEKAELEQKAASSNREFDRSQKYIDYLKEDLTKKHSAEKLELEKQFRKEREELKEGFENEKDEVFREHRKEIADMKKSFNAQMAELEKRHNKDKGSMKESHARERKELEENFTREKASITNHLTQEHEHNLSVKLTEAQKVAIQEKNALEKTFNEEKLRWNQSQNLSRTEHELSLQQLRSDLERKFTEDKARIEEQHVIDKAEIEQGYKRQIAELQQAFSEGETGLKGQLKDDFRKLLAKHKAELESSFQREKQELQESFTRERVELEEAWQMEKKQILDSFENEKSEVEDSYRQEKEDMAQKFSKSKVKIEEEFKEEIIALQESRNDEFENKLARETELLQKTVEHLQSELNFLKDQKRELETKVQIMELKTLSQKQETFEIIDFKKEKKVIEEKINALNKDVDDLRKEKDDIEKEKVDVEQEKATILENSVREITELQEQLFRLQNEKESLENRVFVLTNMEEEMNTLRKDYSKCQRLLSESQREMTSLQKIRQDNRSLETNLRDIEKKKKDMDKAIQEKTVECSRLEAETRHLQQKIVDIESIHSKELEAQKERLSMMTTAAAAEKSRYIRENQDLREQLNRATLTSERDQALKEKVFNDAKAEVISLNKKLEEKVRRIKEAESACKTLQARVEELEDANQELLTQVRQHKESLSENLAQLRKEKRTVESKSTRSDNLVQELYLENAELTKNFQQAEAAQKKAERNVRQLMEQKRALQRVISKLCGANAIA